jgi:hypothetical protein
MIYYTEINLKSDREVEKFQFFLVFNLILCDEFQSEIELKILQVRG